MSMLLVYVLSVMLLSCNSSLISVLIFRSQDTDPRKFNATALILSSIYLSSLSVVIIIIHTSYIYQKIFLAIIWENVLF